MPNPPAVVIRLINATAHGLVKWQAIGNGFQAKVGKATATVYSRDGDGVAPYALTVTAEGAPPVAATGDTEDRAYNEAFRALYAAAATSSVDAAPAVSELLAELERLQQEDEPF